MAYEPSDAEIEAAVQAYYDDDMRPTAPTWAWARVQMKIALAAAHTWLPRASANKKPSRWWVRCCRTSRGTRARLCNRRRSSSAPAVSSLGMRAPEEPNEQTRVRQRG